MLAREPCGREPEGAARVIAPVLELEREREARNRDDEWHRIELAAALVGAALADATQHDALLREATALLAGLPAELQGLKTVAIWRAEIDAARKRDAATCPAPRDVAVAGRALPRSAS